LNAEAVCSSYLILAIAIMLYRAEAIVKDPVGWITHEGEWAGEEAQ
jgi:hypothetical protein